MENILTANEESEMVTSAIDMMWAFWKSSALWSSSSMLFLFWRKKSYFIQKFYSDGSIENFDISIKQSINHYLIKLLPELSSSPDECGVVLSSVGFRLFAIRFNQVEVVVEIESKEKVAKESDFEQHREHRREPVGFVPDQFLISFCGLGLEVSVPRNRSKTFEAVFGVACERTVLIQSL